MENYIPVFKRDEQLFTSYLPGFIKPPRPCPARHLPTPLASGHLAGQSRDHVQRRRGWEGAVRKRSLNRNSWDVPTADHWRLGWDSVAIFSLTRNNDFVKNIYFVVPGACCSLQWGTSKVRNKECPCKKSGAANPSTAPTPKWPLLNLCLQSSPFLQNNALHVISNAGQ